MPRTYIAKIPCESTQQRDAIERTVSQPEIKALLKFLGDDRIPQQAFDQLIDTIGTAMQNTLLDALAEASINPDETDGD